MASFLVERFWPGVTRADVEVATAALRAGGVEVIETILAAPDEVCLWYVEAASAGAVTEAFEAAAVTLDRLTIATRLEPPAIRATDGPAERRPTRRDQSDA